MRTTAVSDNLERATGVLWDFIGAMNSWQREVIKNQKKLMKGDLEAKRGLLEKVHDIFLKFIVDPTLPENICFPSKPSYSLDGEKIVETKKLGKKIFVVTDRKTIVPHLRIKYTLVEIDGEFKLVDKIQRFQERTGKFVEWDFLM